MYDAFLSSIKHQTGNTGVCPGVCPGQCGIREQMPRAQAAHPALIDSAVGIAVILPNGRLLLVLALTLVGGMFDEIDAIADPARLRQLDLVVLDA